ncbi:fucose-binding lectin II [uncultured Secundilactobacillus sp.]|uniref:fucose-binding lectin II n=1 Tax=uncultured Secundilactobacillus sp. TaxID=2813935 RepID=UPI002584AB98|nr:fucose-binding lectin II [uncultured Secundilactobacillus sp.]
MKKHILLTTILASTLFVVGGLQRDSAHAATTFKTSTSKVVKAKTGATVRYAKKMLTTNKNGFTTDAAPIFSRSAYPTSGAADGYSDFLLGLKGNGYKFTSRQKAFIRKNLVLNSKSDAATLSKAIVGLKAIGYNPQKFRPYGSQKTLNLVAQLYQSNINNQTTSALSQVLIAVSTGNYKQPKNAKFSRTKLAMTLSALQQTNHGWAYDNQLSNVDTDTTAMAVIALARSKSTTQQVKTSLIQGQNYLKSKVATTGAFGYNYLGKTVLNANSTAEAVLAYATKLNTVKYVNHSRSIKTQNTSPLTALFKYVNSTGSIKGASSQLYGIGQVNLAIAAYKTALHHRSVYTIS